MMKINWFALIGAVLTMIALAAAFFVPWWQLVIGDQLLTINASPFNTNFHLLGTPLTIPLLLAINIGSTLTFLASAIVMLLYAFLPTKTYAKDLLSFGYRKPLYATISLIVAPLIGLLIIEGFLNTSVPLIGQTTITIPPNLLPNNTASVSLMVSTAFLWPFWIIVAAATLCILARIYHGWLVLKTQPQTQPTQNNASLN